MNDTDLEKLLKSAPSPEPSAEFLERLPPRISARIHWQEDRSVERRSSTSRPWMTLAWATACVAVCLLISFRVGSRQRQEPLNELLRNQKLIHEVLAMFPNQVEAIIQDENGLRLSIADKADVPNSTPLWIRVCDGGHCRSIVTFSGQTVRIAGQRVEALDDAHGGVLLVGDHFLWSSEERDSPNHLRISAQQLDHTL